MRRSKIALALLFWISVLCVAQTQFPNTPAGHQCAAWLESFNRGDAKAHLEFLQKNWPERAQNLSSQMIFRPAHAGSAN